MTETTSLPRAHAPRQEPCAACGRISLDRNAAACLSCGAPLSAPRLHTRHRGTEPRKKVPSHGLTARVAPGRQGTLEWTPQVPATQALTQRNTPRPRPRPPAGESETRREVPRPDAGAEVIQMPGVERAASEPEPVVSTMAFEFEFAGDDAASDRSDDGWADDAPEAVDQSEPDLDLSRARRGDELDDSLLEMSGLGASRRRSWLLVLLAIAAIGGAVAGFAL